MQNFAGGRGDTMTFTGIAVSAGAGVLLTDILGVAEATYLSSETGVALLVGVYTLDKTTGEAWTLGQKLYWDNGTKKLTTTVGTNKRAGVATAIAASGDTTGPCNINRGF